MEGRPRPCVELEDVRVAARGARRAGQRPSARARRLVEQDHVFAIVNTYVEVVAFQSVIDYLNKAGVPLIQGAAESQTSAALSPVNFVTAPSGLFWARELPQMVKRFTTATKIGLTYVDVPTETNALKYLRPEFSRVGITIVDEEKVAAEEDAVTN